MTKGHLSLVAFVFSCLFLVTVSFMASKWSDWGSQKLISWDSSGYYMYLPGFFYDDLGELNNHQYIIDTYSPCGDFLNEYKSSIGKYVIKYSCGMAILYFPGFVLGHIWAKMFGYPIDGFSYPYQFSMAMYSLLVSFLGLWFARKLLLKYFTDSVTAVTILSIVFATNYLNYSSISNMFPHNYLFTVYLLIILVTWRWHRSYTYKYSILIGLLCGLSALSRPTEVICVIIPFIWGIGENVTVKERIRTLMVEWKKLFVLLLSAFLIGSVQFIYWKIYSGRFIYWSYGDDDGLNFLRVHFYKCLFSYKKGWFVYTPFMILSVIGFIPLYVRYKQLFWFSFIFTVIALYIVFSWKNWAYGGSFSMRAVVQYYAIFIFPLAAFIEFVFRTHIRQVAFTSIFIFCIWLNLIMTYQANGANIMESDNMSAKYYWKIFGRLHLNKNDKKFIDTDEEMPDELGEKLQLIYQNNFCNDFTDNHCTNYKGERAFLMTKDVDFIPEARIDISDKKGNWFRVTCEAHYESNEGNYWSQPLLYAWISDANRKDIKQKSYRIQRIASGKGWEKFSIDIFIPVNLNAKYLKAGIFNAKGNVRVYVKNLKIELAR